MTTPEATAQAPPNLDRRVAGYVSHLRDVAEGRGRSDLAGRLRDEFARLTALEATLVVTGETKKGKSSLVNALLGRAGLLPVAADVATNARIVVRYADSEYARVLREGREPEEISVDDIASWASTTGNPNNEKGVQLVEVGISDDLLRQGLTVVDTPGVGGLGAAHAEITLAALATADALLFVLDGSSPLTEPELAFLRRATDRIGTILFVLTKRDLYGGWQQTVKENRTLLSKYSPEWKEAPILPVSSRAALRAGAFRSAGDDAFADRLAAQSGFQELESLLTTDVIVHAQSLRKRNLLQLARSTLGELGKADTAALAAAEGDPSLQAALEEAAAQKRAFAKERKVGSVALSDELNLLAQNLNLEFNRQLQELRTRYDRDIKANRLKPEAVAEGLDSDLRAVLTRIDEVLSARTRDIAERLVGEINGELSLAGAAFVLPDGLVGAAEDGSTDAGLAQRVTTLMPSIFQVTGLGGGASLLGGALGVGAALIPVGVAAGLVLVPVTLVARRRTRDQQEAANLLRGGLERAKSEMQPLLAETIIRLRKAFQADLETEMERQERELSDAVEEQQRLLSAETSKRAAARGGVQERIKELEKLRQHANQLDGMIVARASRAA